MKLSHKLLLTTIKYTPFLISILNILYWLISLLNILHLEILLTIKQPSIILIILLYICNVTYKFCNWHLAAITFMLSTVLINWILSICMFSIFTISLIWGVFYLIGIICWVCFILKD